MKSVYYLTNGIRTSTDQAKNWCASAVTKLVLKGKFAVGYRYHTFALTRRFGLGKHVRAVAADLDKFFFQYFDTHVVGHSNGCEIQRQAMVKKHCSVSSCHWYGAAVEADFEKNGLNEYLINHPTCKLYIYISDKDFVLKRVAKASRFLTFGWLGYGSLGATGPTNVSPRVSERVQVIVQKGYKHTTYIKHENIDDRVFEILNPPPPVTHGMRQ